MSQDINSLYEEIDRLQDRIRTLETMTKKITHCPKCGSTWYDDGFTAECPQCRVRRVENDLTHTRAALEELKADKKAMEAAWAFYRHTTKGPHIVCEYEAFERGWALALTDALDRAERMEKGEE